MENIKTINSVIIYILFTNIIKNHLKTS